MNYIRRNARTPTLAQLGLPPPGKSEAWAVASAEILDRAGDVIRVSGLTAALPMPLLAGHQHIASDGSPTVIGSVVETKRVALPVEGKTVPALAARWTWASGELPDKWRGLWDAGHIRTVSIGAMVKDARPLANGAFDIVAAELVELSVVAVPANPSATALKSIAKALGLDPGAPTDLLADVAERLERFEKRLERLADDGECVASVLADVRDELDRATVRRGAPAQASQDDHAAVAATLRNAIAKIDTLNGKARA